MTSQRLPVSDSSCWKIFLGIGWQHVFFRSHCFASKRILTPNITFEHLYCFFQHSSRISFEVSPQLCWLASMCAALSHQAWMRIAVKQHIIEGVGSCIWSSLKIFLVPFAWTSIWHFQWFIHKCHCLILSTWLRTHIHTQAAWDVTAEWTDFVMAKAYALFQGLRSAESAQHSWQFFRFRCDFFSLNSSMYWECRWCAENFHKKLLPFLAERFVAKIAFHRHVCFQQRVLSSNHVQNCLIWSWKQLFEASRFPSMKPWMIQDIWEEYPTMNVCTSVKVSGKCYEGSMLTTRRSSKNSWRGHWRLRVSINLHSVLPQIKKPRLLGMANLEMKWMDMNGYVTCWNMASYHCFPTLRSQLHSRFQDSQISTWDHKKGLNQKKDSPFVCLKKWMHPNVCFFSRL